MRTLPSSPTRLLAVDSASPMVSVALGCGAKLLASRAMAIAHSSEGLLGAIDDVVREAGISPNQIEGLIGLRGPGSFTGLRVGLATLLGLHQALDIPAVAIPTLEVLFLAAPAAAGRVVTTVDALRGEWFSQLFENGEKIGEPEILSVERLVAHRPDCVVCHEPRGLRDALPAGVQVVEAGQLAPLALRFAAQHVVDWSPATLLDPLYLRPPALHRKSPTPNSDSARENLP